MSKQHPYQEDSSHPRDPRSFTSSLHYPISVSNPSTHPHPRTISPPNSISPLTEPSTHLSSPPSPPQIRHTSLFPHPHSAPHHLSHFASSVTSYPPNMDRYSIHPLQDQRRMSEPVMYASTANNYPSSAVDLSDARFPQFSYVSPPSYPALSSPHPPSSHTRLLCDSSRKDDNKYHHDSVEEPLSPLNPTFSGGESPPPMGMSEVVLGSLYEDYGPSPPGTGTSTSSNDFPTHQQSSPTGAQSSPSGAKQYSFVSLPGNGIKKRPRRRYDEIERLYQCSWQNCTKAYGTLNHLNAHITMQKHGPKRSPNEFKELRKQWRKAKKEEAETRALDEVRRGSQHLSQHTSSCHSMSNPEYMHNIRPSFDYAPPPARSIHPVPPLNDDHHDSHQRDIYPRRSQRLSPIVSPHPQHGGMAHLHHIFGASSPSTSLNRLPTNSTLLTPLPDYEPSPINRGPDFNAYSSYDMYRSDTRSRTGHESSGRQGGRGRPRSSHDWSQS